MKARLRTLTSTIGTKGTRKQVCSLCIQAHPKTCTHTTLARNMFTFSSMQNMGKSTFLATTFLLYQIAEIDLRGKLFFPQVFLNNQTALKLKIPHHE